MPTTEEIQKLKFEIESLRDRRAKAEGRVEGLRQRLTGGQARLAKMKKRLSKLEKMLCNKLLEYRQKYGRLAKS